MFYQLKGDITFQLPTPYYHVLQFWVDKHHLEHIIFLFPQEMRFNGLLELHEVKDIFFFLNKFAVISHAQLIATRRDHDYRSFQLHDGLIYEFPYVYHLEKQVAKPIAHLIDIVQKKNFKIHIPYEQFSRDELDTFESAILAIKHQKKNAFEEEIAILASFVQQKKFIELLTEQEKVRWDNATSETVFSFPFALSDQPRPIEVDAPILSAYEYNEEETRRFTWNAFSFPLHALFLSSSAQKTITLPTGETTHACSQCVFRLRQLTGGCSPCAPALLPES